MVLRYSGIQIPNHLEDTTEQMAGSPLDVVPNLAHRDFNHLYIEGSATIRGFLDAGLVDSIILTRVPILLGAGTSLFDGLQKEIVLDHITTQSFDCGLLQSEYRIACANPEQDAENLLSTRCELKSE